MIRRVQVLWVGMLCLAGLPALEAAEAWLQGQGFRSRLLTPGATGKTGFTRLGSIHTGMAFTNRLSGDARITNSVAQNGSGVAIGDVDGDGRPDLYLACLEGPNRLYRNLGDWKFAALDLGAAACTNQLSTGVALVDVDGDGDLDLLVNGIAAGTRLFLNDGKARFGEVTNSGLSRTSTPMSLALADIDGDGDLDVYCAHYADAVYLADPTIRLSFRTELGRPVVDRVNGQPATMPPWKNRFHVKPEGGVIELPESDALYRNDGRGRFTDISVISGVFLDAEGRAAPRYRDWGLGVMFRDVNGDGAPDFYVCNDSGAEDRFWINTGQGTFRAAAMPVLRHASYSSMGIDFADLDRDGHDDFFVVDMLSRDAARRKNQLSRSPPDTLDVERSGARPMYPRNTLFMGRADGTFAETALMSGVAATDWSWCPMFLDVDLDGYEDLIVSNGFEQDVLDQDTTDGFRRKKWTPDEVRRYRAHYPAWLTKMAAYRNRGDATFEAMNEAWGFTEAGVANGSALGDLDGDGDLDLMVNRFNGEAALYRNDSPAPRIAVRLRGRSPNSTGVGARIRVVRGGFVQSQEILGGGRFLSGDEAMRVFAVPTGNTDPIRIEVRWRDGTRSVVNEVEGNRLYDIDQGGASASDPPKAGSPNATAAPLFLDVSARIGHRHVEAAYDDWVRQPLLPRRLSRLGPGVAWYDYDRDGWDDLIIGGARDGKLAVYLNPRNESSFKVLDTVRTNYVDQGAIVSWPDGKGGRDLLVAGSNYEMPSEVPSRISLYAAGAEIRDLDGGPVGLGPLAVADIDGDGDLDLFVGGRVLAGRYPEAVDSMIWRNDQGEFERGPELTEPFRALGLAAGATWDDLDGDGKPDLVVALEWGAVRVFRNLGGKFEDQTAAWGFARRTGFWMGVTTGDFDGDGRPDLAVGNWGRNSVHALSGSPVLRAYFADWNGDGRYPVFEAARQGDVWRPILDRLRLDRGMPDLQSRFPNHATFSVATVDEVIGAGRKTTMVEANEFASGVYLNRGSVFEWVPFPIEAQRAPVFSVNVSDFDGDGVEDVFLAQNFFGNAPGLSRDDAGTGLWLRGFGTGRFEAMDVVKSGIHLHGEQRGAALADFNHDGRVDLAVTQNDDRTALFLNQGAKPGLVVKLVGGAGNPDMIGAQLRVGYEGGSMGPTRSVHDGSGYGGLDATTQVLGLRQKPVSVWVRWPGGAEKTVLVPEGVRELRIAR